MRTYLMIATAVLFGSGAMGLTKPLNLSLTPEVTVYDSRETIRGITLSVWGQNPQAALALGIINGALGDSSGASVGMLNYAETYKGLQWGLVNHAERDFYGWQGGFLFGFPGSVMNYTGGTMLGLQTGVVNYAGRLLGVQFGLVNFAEEADPGIQLGLVNIVQGNVIWFRELPNALGPVMVLGNWRF